jgi:hypothetical protein
MEDIKAIIKEFGALLKPYGFEQKGSSRIFFYDCGWHLFFVHIDKSSNGLSLLTGINYCWDHDTFFHCSLRDEAKFYKFNDEPLETFLPNECLRIKTRREDFINTYKDPKNMIQYFKKNNDYSCQPHGYFISRIFENINETKYFEEAMKNLIEMYNKPPYLGPRWDLRPKNLQDFEADMEIIFKMQDNDFKIEIIKRINEKRKKLKLNILENYF